MWYQLCADDEALTIALFVIFSLIIILDIAIASIEFTQPMRTRNMWLALAKAARNRNYFEQRTYLHPVDQHRTAQMAVPSTGPLDRRTR